MAMIVMATQPTAKRIICARAQGSSRPPAAA